MRHSLASGLFLAGIALAGFGCATDIRVDFDHPEGFSRYRTWDWLPSGRKLASEATEFDRRLEAAVRGAIMRGLRERGYERTTVGRPDFLVAYQLTVERELVRRTETPAMQTLSTFHREGGFEITASELNIELYEKGTFVLAVTDGGDQRRVWRATAIRRVRESFLPRAEHVVSEVFEHFPSVSDAWL